MGSSRRFPLRSLLWVATVLLFAGSVTFAMFSQTTANAGDNYGASSDWKAPTVDRAAIQRNGGNDTSTGYVRQGQSYFVYANVTDIGNPASGISSVTANVSTVTTGQTSAALTFGSWTVNGQTYNYRSSALTSDNPLSEGSKSFSIAAADNNSNSATTSGFSVTVDNTAPTISATRLCAGSNCSANYVGASKIYYIYANASDAASGVDSLTADVSNITTGSSSVALTSCSSNCTVNGTTYSYKSAAQTANSGLTNGSTPSWTLTVNDNALNQSNTSPTATVDNNVPSFGPQIICGGKGCSSNYVGAGNTYYIYANASDAASGIDYVSADVSNITTGASSVPLTTCSSNCTVNGTTYSYKSAAQTANSGLTNGSTPSWTLNVKDNAGNGPGGGFTATVDNTAPTLTRAQIQRTANNNPGYFKQGDGFYVYGEPNDGASGVDTATITTNVAVAGNVITTGKTSVTMCSNGGPFTVGGQSYTYRSDDDGTCGGTATALTSNSSITDGSMEYDVTFSDNAGNTTTDTSPRVTEDSTVPTVPSSTLSKSTGYLAGKLKSSAAYDIYANSSDAGVGISTVTSNVAVTGNVITAGQTAVSLSSGSYSTQGTSYNYRDAITLTSGTLTNGTTYNYTVTPTDALGNTQTVTFSITGDTAAPDASDIQCTNGGATAGKPDDGDICNFSHTDNIDPFSVNPIANWTGTSTTVAVRFLDAGTGSSPAACDTGGNDTMVIYNAANTSQVTAMGCVNLGDSDYVPAGAAPVCTSSTLQQPTVPGTVNRVTLGGCPSITPGSGNSTSGYFPSTSLYDAAGNNLTDTKVQNETGTADRDF
jgi:hypothetical protein